MDSSVIIYECMKKTFGRKNTMKKRLLTAITVACLIMAGCSDGNNTAITNTTPASYETMDAAPGESANESVDTGSGAESYDNDSMADDSGLSYDGPSGDSSSDAYDYDPDPGMPSTPSYSHDTSNDDSSDFDFDSSPSISNTAGDSQPDSSSEDGLTDTDNADGSDSDTDVQDSESDTADTKDSTSTESDNQQANDQQTNDQQANEQQSNDSQTNDQQTNDDQTNNQQDENQSDNAGLGKIFFVGDSRTVDMFDGNTSEIYDYDAGGIRVFARDGCHCAYLTDVLGNHSMDEFDTLVSWLGCNDNNDAALYEQVYENLISQGKTVIVCTVGPTRDEFLSGDFDTANYPNEKMIAFNRNITAWAGSHGVRVIDLYSFVQNNIEISPDGIHYNPKPTTAIWNYIISSL